MKNYKDNFKSYHLSSILHDPLFDLLKKLCIVM